jgi:hypothetical protein
MLNAQEKGWEVLKPRHDFEKKEIAGKGKQKNDQMYTIGQEISSEKPRSQNSS